MSSLAKRDSALVLLSLIFFIWGLITVVSNSLIPHYKAVFALDYKTAMLFPMAFFISRIAVSIPTSFVMAKIGYKATLQYCLFWCFGGCLVMAYLVQSEELLRTLVGIFIMASGISAIQVVSSPYVSLLASPDKSIRRQSIATASNSIGTVLGPIALSAVIIAASGMGYFKTAEQISILFLCISLFFLTLILYFRAIDLPDIQPNVRRGFWKGLGALIKQADFVKLALVLLLYIGVEVCFGTFTITYLADENYGDLGLVRATQIIAGYWALMFLGRLMFAKYGSRINSLRLFIIMCSVSIMICLLAMLITDVFIGYVLICVGLCNSTLYPIIYARALSTAKQYSSQGAAILIMCSIGGALLPLAQATMVDLVGLRVSYWLPAISYLLMIGLFVQTATQVTAQTKT